MPAMRLSCDESFEDCRDHPRQHCAAGRRLRGFGLRPGRPNLGSPKGRRSPTRSQTRYWSRVGRVFGGGDSRAAAGSGRTHRHDQAGFRELLRLGLLQAQAGQHRWGRSPGLGRRHPDDVPDRPGNENVFAGCTSRCTNGAPGARLFRRSPPGAAAARRAPRKAGG